MTSVVHRPEVTYDYQPLDAPSRWAIGALVAVIVLDVVAFVSDYLEGDILDLVAAALAIAVVWALTKRQSIRAAARRSRAEAWSTASS
jgi:hypothetical protein